MTSQATTPVHLCLCGCGTEITPESTWARGHFRRGEGTYAPVPGPGELPPDLEAMFPDEHDPFGPTPSPGGFYLPGGPPPGEGPADDLAPDPEPAGLRDQAARSAGRGPVTVKAAIRRDILAKVSLPLETGAQIWKARDPVCGGRAVEVRPATADALTDIICQSADLVDFFTGPAGGFMVYLKLAAALWPLAEVVMANHVFGHGHGQAAEQQQRQAQDLSRYAA